MTPPRPGLVDALTDGMTWADIKQAKRAAVWDSWLERAAIAHAPAGWTEDAECRGCRTFTADLCDGCPARLACIADAYRTEHHDTRTVHGVRGGIPADHRAEWYRRNVPPPMEHGTDSAYKRCVARPEGSCADCRRAHADHEHRRRCSPPVAFPRLPLGWSPT